MSQFILDDRRFSGLARLYGVTGAQQIRGAHVVVVGIGGVGSWTAEALARSGVSELTLIDLDHIADSNINRQIHALEPTVGQAKVQAMAERIAQIQPECQVHAIDDFVTPSNWSDLLLSLGRSPSGVIDACDQVKTKTALAAWARQSGVPFVSVGAAGGKRAAQQVEVSDLSEVTHDPLLAQVRYQLRKFHAARRDRRMKVACVFSREAVQQPHASCQLPGAQEDGNDGTLNCAGYGSVVSVTATFGLVAAGWMLDQLAASSV
jgi:tRNA A37 threonylcarbamoyladenosine dehydratase